MIAKYGVDGAIFEQVLRDQVVPMLNARILEQREPATLKKCTAEEARDVLRNRQGKLGATFFLTDAQWVKFKAHLEQHPYRVMARSDVGPCGHGPLSGHAVVIEAELPHPSVINGIDPVQVDTSQFWVLKNSWGPDSAAIGSFMVACDALDLEFYHVQVPETWNDLQGLFRNAVRVPGAPPNRRRPRT